MMEDETKRCGNCRHWGDESDEAFAQYTPGWRKCIGINDAVKDPYDDPALQAFTADEHGFYSCLTTRAAFGCVLFEPKVDL